MYSICKQSFLLKRLQVLSCCYQDIPQNSAPQQFLPTSSQQRFKNSTRTVMDETHKRLSWKLLTAALTNDKDFSALFLLSMHWLSVRRAPLLLIWCPFRAHPPLLYSTIPTMRSRPRKVWECPHSHTYTPVLSPQKENNTELKAGTVKCWGSHWKKASWSQATGLTFFRSLWGQYDLGRSMLHLGLHATPPSLSLPWIYFLHSLWCIEGHLCSLLAMQSKQILEERWERTWIRETLCRLSLKR